MIQATTPSQNPEELLALELLAKKYRLARFRFTLLLLIPALWIIGGILISAIFDMYGAGVPIMLIWIFVVLFGVGAWVFLMIPHKLEIERQYAKLVVPALLKQEGIQAEYYQAHTLATASFLKSGLYQEKYSTIRREDSVTGKALGMPFGMYQLAVQVSTPLGRSAFQPRTTLLTNHFYGWVIQCGITPVAGRHVLLFKTRKTSHESDDWLAPVQKYWQTNPECPPLFSGNPVFDAHFLLFSDRPKVAEDLFHPEVRQFLLYLAETSENAFAISISGNVLTMHIGHSEPTFRSCPKENFGREYHPRMLEEAKWFSDLLKGMRKSFVK